MNGVEVKDYLIDFQKGSLPEVVKRELEFNAKITLINTIIGPRRAGKTYFLYQLIRGLDKSIVLYLNFEDTRLSTINFKDFLNIVSLHVELFGKEPEYALLDEPQNIDSWERGVRSLFDKRKFKIILTGSSSKLLSEEIATQLRGRAIKHLLLPYSFKEYLKSQSFKVPSLLTSTETAGLRNQLNNYLSLGGYPEVVKSDNVNEKLKILESYKELIIYKDVIERHEIRAPFLVKFLIDSLITSFAKEFSVNSFFNTLKSRGVKVSKKSLYTYLGFIEDSLSIFLLERFSPKLKERRLAPKKVYLCDNGLAYRQREELGRLMENAVLLELKRLQDKYPLTELYYWKDYQLREVDFVLKEGRRVTQLIQVTNAEDKINLNDREVVNLLTASKELKCNQLTVITWNYEHIEKIGTKRVAFIPLWKWLLE